MSVTRMSWESDWLKVDTATRTQTPFSWRLSTASLRAPVGGKLISEHQRQNVGKPYDPVWLPLSEINVDELTNSAKPFSAVAPGGAQSSQWFYGSRDVCSETFFAYIPDRLRASSISIDFTFEDNSLTTRQSSMTLYRELPARAETPTA